MSAPRAPAQETTFNRNDHQMWFFLFEKKGVSTFHQSVKTWKQIQAQSIEGGCGLDACLAETGKKDIISDKCQFWILSDSMGRTAVQIITDKHLTSSYDAFCTTDPVVTITVRENFDVSPNTSEAGSACNSYAIRQKIARERIPSFGKATTLSSVRIRTKMRDVSGSSDIVSGEPLAELPENEKMVLDLGDGKSETYTTEYVLGWVQASLKDNYTELTDITLDSHGQYGMKTIKLSNHVWRESLLRGPRKEDFLHLWSTQNEVKASRAQLRKTIRDNTKFKQGVDNFLRDLRDFDPKAQNRLKGKGNTYLLGPPYFDLFQVKEILSTRTMRGTAESDLEMLLESKYNKGGFTCAAHDLAPIYEATFAQKWDKKAKIFEYKDLSPFESSLENLSLSEASAGPAQDNKFLSKGLGTKASEFFNKNVFKKQRRDGGGQEARSSSGFHECGGDAGSQHSRFCRNSES